MEQDHHSFSLQWLMTLGGALEKPTLYGLRIAHADEIKFAFRSV